MQSTHPLIKFFFIFFLQCRYNHRCSVHIRLHDHHYRTTSDQILFTWWIIRHSNETEIDTNRVFKHLKVTNGLRIIQYIKPKISSRQQKTINTHYAGTKMSYALELYTYTRRNNNVGASNNVVSKNTPCVTTHWSTTQITLG